MRFCIKVAFALCLFMLLLRTDHTAQAQIVTTVRDTLCSGDTVFGYYNTGIYRDTFTASGGGDSIRELDLKVIPRVGTSPLPRWFNTGTNGSGGRLPGGSSDMNWEVSTGNINGPYVPAIVMSSKPGSYATSAWPDCDWISHSAGGSHSGNIDYYYRIDFDLPCFDSCGSSFDAPNTFCLTLDFFADNSVFEIYANGVPQSPNMGGVIPVANPNGHTGFTNGNMVSLTLCNDWKRGYNSLIIHIKSGAPYAAFLAQASVNAPPPPPIRADFDMAAAAGTGPDSAGCAPFTVAFTNTSVSAADYTWNFGDGSPVSNDPSPVHTYTTPGVYTVTLVATNTLCGFQQDTAQAVVTVYETALPDIVVSDTLVCTPGKIDLSVLIRNPTPNNRFLWQPATGITGPDDQSSAVVDPSLHTTYWVTVWDTIPGVCGFSVTDTIHIEYAPRALTLFNSDTAVCEGDVVSISGQVTPGYSLLWTPATGVSNVTSLTPDITINQSETYTLTASYPGCPDTSVSISFDMQHYPVVVIGPDTAVCEGEYMFLRPSVSPPRDDYSYLWTTTVPGLNNADQPVANFIATTSGVYELLVSTPAGCTGFDDRLIDVYPGDFGSIIEDTAYCPPDSVLLWASGAYRYHWTPAYGLSDTAAAEPVARPYETTDYTVYAFDTLGCRDTLHVRVSVYPRAVISLPDTMHIYPGEPRYMDPATNCLYFQWFPYAGLSQTNIANPEVYPEVNTRYFVTATTEHNCIAKDSVDVLVHCSRMAVPNVFVPGTGANRYFRPVKEGLMQLNRFAVFNRWGVKVFEATGADDGWDGTYNNEPQPMGVYVYLIDAVNSCGEPFVQQGNVTLLR